MPSTGCPAGPGILAPTVVVVIAPPPTSRVGHHRSMAKRQLRDLLRVSADSSVDLAGIDSRATPGLPGRGQTGDRRRWAAEQLVRDGAERAEQQQRLYAAAKRGGDRRRLLLVL